MNQKVSNQSKSIDILVLDFKKPRESRILLESIKKYCLFEYRVVFLDNGSRENYPLEFQSEGLVNFLIKNENNVGLGSGTRQLIEAAESEYFLYVQNDQILTRDFGYFELEYLKSLIEHPTLTHPGNKLIKSIGLAGNICGADIYSERAHLINIKFYRSMEPLSEGGAGPRANEIWREEQVQKIYKIHHYSHYIYPDPMFQDNGYNAIRENPDGSLYEHRPDTKELKVIKYPTEKFVYPKWSDQEWEKILKGEKWADWSIPENEIKDSFVVSHWH